MPGTVGGNQLAAITTPQENDPLDASVVRGHLQDIAAEHNAHDLDPTIHVQTFVSLPGSAADGTLVIVGRTLFIRQSPLWVEVRGVPYNSNGFGFPVPSDVGGQSGAVTLDWAVSPVIALTIDGNITGITHTNRIAGSEYTLIMTVGGSGGYTVDLSSYNWDGTPPTITTAIGSVAVIKAIWTGTKMLAQLVTNGA